MCTSIKLGRLHVNNGSYIPLRNLYQIRRSNVTDEVKYGLGKTDDQVLGAERGSFPHFHCLFSNVCTSYFSTSPPPPPSSSPSPLHRAPPSPLLSLIMHHATSYLFRICIRLGGVMLQIGTMVHTTVKCGTLVGGV